MKKKMYIIPLFIPHLGCPFKCVFCNQNSITGQQQEITEEYVRQTIETHLKTLPSNAEIEVSFFGGSFTGIPQDKSSQNQVSTPQSYKRYLKISLSYLQVVLSLFVILI